MPQLSSYAPLRPQGPRVLSTLTLANLAQVLESSFPVSHQPPRAPGHRSGARIRVGTSLRCARLTSGTYVEAIAVVNSVYNLAIHMEVTNLGAFDHILHTAAAENIEPKEKRPVENRLAGPVGKERAGGIGRAALKGGTSHIPSEKRTSVGSCCATGGALTANACYYSNGDCIIQTLLALTFAKLAGPCPDTHSLKRCFIIRDSSQAFLDNSDRPSGLTGDDKFSHKHDSWSSVPLNPSHKYLDSKQSMFEMYFYSCDSGLGRKDWILVTHIMSSFTL
ncbi:hypothetical protein MJG53_015696 [Ovis ammon polii x Ovis aries]|uniref:Uncharacterized protein n=1 Tax=Ovis ammon polii x Ovis aries TaxID=2918886 RepID=A0ACB9UGH7_9CETA|nr:hypothetical protein MJG53_015696 [Ovis ammon polii x Ovis aries]